MLLLLGLAILAACADARSSGGMDNMCEWCDYDIAGNCYLEGPDCRHYYQCVRNPSGWVDKQLKCCPNRTEWNPVLKTCDWGHDCDVPPDCKDDDPEEGNCTLIADDKNAAWYYTYPTWHHLMCPAGTVFSQEKCTCVHGYGYKCYYDPLLFFPFAKDFNDIQCPKAQGRPHGDAHLPMNGNEWGGYMRLDGDGDYMSFSYLNNWFAGNSPPHFTVSIWIKQTEEGFFKSGIFEGVFSNGNCHEMKSIWLTTLDQEATGGVGTSGGKTFMNGGFYGPPKVWCQLAIRFNRDTDEVTYFLNGNPVDRRPSKGGDLVGTMQDATVGAIFHEVINNQCKDFYFTGCIDDLIVFDRFVSDWEMYQCVWGNGRTKGHSEKMYTCPEHQPQY